MTTTNTLDKIPQHLIEKSLALTGKTMEDIEEIKTIDHGSYGHEPFGVFSIEKFCYYLLSPEFIDKHPRSYSIGQKHFLRSDIANAIGEYQRRDKEFPEGNPADLISLLEKI